MRASTGSISGKSNKNELLSIKCWSLYQTLHKTTIKTPSSILFWLSCTRWHIKRLHKDSNDCLRIRPPLLAPHLTVFAGGMSQISDCFPDYAKKILNLQRILVLTSFKLGYFRSSVCHSGVCTPWQSPAVLEGKKTFWVSTHKAEFLRSFSYCQGLCIFRVPNSKGDGVSGNKKGKVDIFCNRTI